MERVARLKLRHHDGGVFRHWGASAMGWAEAAAIVTVCGWVAGRV